MGYYVALVATVGAGSLSVLVAIAAALLRVRLLRRGLRSTGTIVDAHITTSSMRSKPGSAAVSPVIEVVDASKGSSFRFRSWLSTSVTDTTLGARVPVRYMAGDPDMAEIDRLAPMWGPPLLFLLVGLVLLGAGWLVWTGVAVT